MTLLQLAKSFILPPIRLSPTGQSNITEPTFWLHRVVTASLRGLVGERISQSLGFGLIRAERVHYYNYQLNAPQHEPESPHFVSLVASTQWNKQTLRSGWRSFQLISCLAALSVFILGKAVFLLPAVAWAWLGYELAKIEIWEQPFSKFTPLEMFGTVIGKLMIVAFACCGISTLFPVLFYWVTFGLSGWMLPFLLTGILGAYALMVRLLRVSASKVSPASPYQHLITCQVCRFPMRRLNTTELRQHLTPQQHTEITLKSKFHEGWQCQHCLPPHHPQDLSIHLSSYILNRKGYEECPTCQTLTVEVTHYTLTKSTKKKKESAPKPVIATTAKLAEQEKLSYQSDLRHKPLSTTVEVPLTASPNATQTDSKKFPIDQDIVFTYSFCWE